MRMEYGPEGSQLVEPWEFEPTWVDEYPSEVRGPRAYVELVLDTPYGALPDNGHDDIIAALAAWSPVPVAWQDDYTGEWS